jgi:hypothetical protein
MQSKGPERVYTELLAPRRARVISDPRNSPHHTKQKDVYGSQIPIDMENGSGSWQLHAIQTIGTCEHNARGKQGLCVRNEEGPILDQSCLQGLGARRPLRVHDARRYSFSLGLF